MVHIHYCLQADVKHKGGGKEESSSFCGLWGFCLFVSCVWFLLLLFGLVSLFVCFLKCLWPKQLKKKKYLVNCIISKTL